MSVLQQLIGKKVRCLNHQLSRTIPLNSKGLNEVFDLFLAINFDDFIVNVYNKHRIVNADLEELLNLQLTEVSENDSEIVFHFGDKKLVIDITDDGYTGPEALSLRGPNDLIVVWS